MSYFTTALFIGFLSLDTTIAFQVLVSQPIFSCPIIGLLLGNAPLGFEIGLLMQLIWLSSIPAGATSFPEGNLASMIVCAVMIYFEKLPEQNILLTLTFLFGILVSYLGASVTELDRRINGKLLNLINREADEGKVHQITILEGGSILIYFLLMSALAYVSLNVAAWAIAGLQGMMAADLDAKLVIIKPVILGLGFGLTWPMFFKALRINSK